MRQIFKSPLALPEAAVAAMAKWGVWCMQQAHKTPLTTLHTVRILHLYSINPNSAAFLMWKGQKLESLFFDVPWSEYMAIIVIYFTYYIYRDVNI